MSKMPFRPGMVILGRATPRVDGLRRSRAGLSLGFGRALLHARYRTLSDNAALSITVRLACGCVLDPHPWISSCASVLPRWGTNQHA